MNMSNRFLSLYQNAVSIAAIAERYYPGPKEDHEVKSLPDAQISKLRVGRTARRARAFRSGDA